MRHELLHGGLVSTDGESVRDVAVKGAISTRAMLVEHLHKVIEVNVEGSRALVEGLSKAANDHNAVRLAVLVAQVFNKFRTDALQVRHE